MQVATQHTRAAGTSLTTISSGQPIMVCGIVVANTDDAAETTVTFTDNSSNDVLTIECNVNSTESCDTTWIAEDGLVIPATATNTIVTVFWRPWV